MAQIAVINTTSCSDAELHANLVSAGLIEQTDTLVILDQADLGITNDTDPAVVVDKVSSILGAAGLSVTDEKVEYVGINVDKEAHDTINRIANIRDAVINLDLDADEATQMASVFQISFDTVSEFTRHGIADGDDLNEVADLYQLYCDGVITGDNFINSMTRIVDHLSSLLNEDAPLPLVPEQETTLPAHLLASSTMGYDVYRAFSSNMANAIEWFQYEQVPTPEEMDEDALLYQRPYGDNVFGVISIENGALYHRVISPGLVDTDGGLRRDVADAYNTSRQDFHRLTELIKPVGDIINYEEVYI